MVKKFFTSQTLWEQGQLKIMLQRIVLGCLMAAIMVPSLALANPILSANVVHSQAYKVHPERGPYVSVIVTPPSARGVDGRVLVEVYNRSKTNLALVKFDIELKNSQGFEIVAQGEAHDLKPNSSGAIWIKLPKNKEKFPVVTAAVIDALRIIDVDAQELKLKTFLTVITK